MTVQTLTPDVQPRGFYLKSSAKKTKKLAEFAKCKMRADTDSLTQSPGCDSGCGVNGSYPTSEVGRVFFKFQKTLCM